MTCDVKVSTYVNSSDGIDTIDTDHGSNDHTYSNDRTNSNDQDDVNKAKA